MIDDAMKGNRMIGMIQPKSFNQKIPDLYKIGCVGKITSFNETEDGRYLIVLSGISRFKILQEINTEKLYRECKVNFNEFKINWFLLSYVICLLGADSHIVASPLGWPLQRS